MKKDSAKVPSATLSGNFDPHVQASTLRSKFPSRLASDTFAEPFKEYGYHIVRVGLAITFLWIGILIFRDPESWGAMVQPWVLELMPLPIKEMMLSTAVLDMVIGFFLLIDVFTWLFALIGALHLVTVLAVTGINAITVRDIGLLGGLLALFVTKFPRKEASNQ